MFHCVSTKQRFEDPIVEDVIDVAAPAIAKILNFPPGEPGRTFITYMSRYVTEKEIKRNSSLSCSIASRGEAPPDFRITVPRTVISYVRAIVLTDKQDNPKKLLYIDSIASRKSSARGQRFRVLVLVIDCRSEEGE